ncbi:MAG: hypothetical protein KC777_19360 [Cyanobacteria bacterium HKST-UBA02]|nr:hypothetical protein [Cyanobacteria bacterium HKST-UBA02]
MSNQEDRNSQIEQASKSSCDRLLFPDELIEVFVAGDESIVVHRRKDRSIYRIVTSNKDSSDILELDSVTGQWSYSRARHEVKHLSRARGDSESAVSSRFNSIAAVGLAAL